MSQENRSAYWRGIVNGISFRLGLTFINPVTVLPAFVSHLTTSEVAVGLVGSIGMGGWFLPQLLVASYLQGCPRKRPLYIFTAVLRGSALLLMGILILVPNRPRDVLVSFFVCYSVYSLLAGVSGPAFLDIVAKTISGRRLGAFFGHRLFWGNVAGLAAAALVRVVLAEGGLAFPLNYSLLFALALVCLVPGWIVFAGIREPVGRVESRQPLSLFLRSVPSVVRADHTFGRLLASQLLIGGVAIALPFYIIYCHRVLHVPEATVGTYLSVQVAGSVVLVPLWAFLNDRRGPRTLLLVIAALSLAVPSLALVISLLPLSPAFAGVAFGAVFFPIAATGAGGFIGATSYLFAIAPEQQRTLYVGIQNTLFSVTMFLPLLGGVVVALTSFSALFLVAVVIGVCGLAATFLLPDRGPASPG
jgi:MFS family permease